MKVLICGLLVIAMATGCAGQSGSAVPRVLVPSIPVQAPCGVTATTSVSCASPAPSPSATN